MQFKGINDRHESRRMVLTLLSYIPFAPKTLSRVNNMRTAITILLAIASASTAHAHPQSSQCNSTSAAIPAATADANAQLLRELQSAPTALDRARLLLVDGETLRTGDELEKLIVFDFDGLQPARGALGGSSKAAVSIPPIFRKTPKP
jgi:hypothetical protein